MKTDLIRFNFWWWGINTEELSWENLRKITFNAFPCKLQPYIWPWSDYIKALIHVTLQTKTSCYLLVNISFFVPPPLLTVTIKKWEFWFCEIEMNPLCSIFVVISCLKIRKCPFCRGESIITEPLLIEVKRPWTGEWGKLALSATANRLGSLLINACGSRGEFAKVCFKLPKNN